MYIGLMHKDTDPSTDFLTDQSTLRYNIVEEPHEDSGEFIHGSTYILSDSTSLSPCLNERYRMTFYSVEGNIQVENDDFQAKA